MAKADLSRRTKLVRALLAVCLVFVLWHFTRGESDKLPPPSSWHKPHSHPYSVFVRNMQHQRKASFYESRMKLFQERLQNLYSQMAQTTDPDLLEAFHRFATNVSELTPGTGTCDAGWRWWNGKVKTSILYVKTSKTGGTMMSDLLLDLVRACNMLPGPYMNCRVRNGLTCHKSEEQAHKSFAGVMHGFDRHAALAYKESHPNQPNGKHHHRKAGSPIGAHLQRGQTCFRPFMKTDPAFWYDKENLPPFTLITLREPLSRFSSAYRYLLRCCVKKLSYCPDSCNPMDSDGKPLNITSLDFIKKIYLPQIQIKQTRFMGIIPKTRDDYLKFVDEYNFAVFQDHYHEGLALLHIKFGFPLAYLLVAVKKENVNKEVREFDIPADFVESYIKPHFQRDIEVYNMMKKRFYDDMLQGLSTVEQKYLDFILNKLLK